MLKNKIATFFLAMVGLIYILLVPKAMAQESDIQARNELKQVSSHLANVLDKITAVAVFENKGEAVLSSIDREYLITQTTNLTYMKEVVSEDAHVFYRDKFELSTPVQDIRLDIESLRAKLKAKEFHYKRNTDLSRRIWESSQ